MPRLDRGMHRRGHVKRGQGEPDVFVMLPDAPTDAICVERVILTWTCPRAAPYIRRMLLAAHFQY